MHGVSVCQDLYVREAKHSLPEDPPILPADPGELPPLLPEDLGLPPKEALEVPSEEPSLLLLPEVAPNEPGELLEEPSGMISDLAFVIKCQKSEY